MTNNQAAERFRTFRPPIALVLGSGLGSLPETFPTILEIPYDAVEALPVSRVPGHQGRFVLADWNGTPVLFACGRVHLYEGWTAHEVSSHIRFFADCEIPTVLLTNAAGSLLPSLPPGDWMMLSDHINLQGSSPLTGSPHFLDQSAVYSPALREIFFHCARQNGMVLHEGVYVGLRGPEYETPAEVRMLGLLGGHAVGMSTVCEAITARSLGMQIAAFSCITNWGAGIQSDAVNHHLVMETGKRATTAFRELLSAALPHILQTSPPSDPTK